MTQPLYPKVSTSTFGLSSSPNFPAIEDAVLRYWQEDDTFKASIAQRDAGENGENEFVFYDGPPFANGLPHYGHLLTGYVKDVVPRFQTMRGKKVDRRFGWDTHGLPAELEAERQLGITDKSEIGRMGLAAFNDACRSSVLRYTQEWEEYVTRQGRWVDFDNDYKTLNVEYMESVIWAFKQLWDKGLVYEGYRVLPYCWKDETPLSNHELRMDDDVYKMRQDPAVTIGYKLKDSDEWVLIWTTTPWTVPSNQAVAVNPEIPLVAVVPGEDGAEELQGKTLILAEARLGAYARELGEDPQVLRTFPGSELVGAAYEPPFPYFEGGQEEFGEKMHTILAADFVTVEDGTGIVHQSPAFGEEDKELTDSYGITAARPVDDAGRFDSTVPDYAGEQVFDANKAIIKDLRNHTGPMESRSALLVRHESYEHSYPHCWRCRNPLIYRAVSSWFVRVTEFKDRMVELNEQINWVPDNVKHGQFGKWLENARDWSISRNRFWGSPIPVWISSDPAYPRTDVYGSLDEIEADFGRLPRNDSGEVDSPSVGRRPDPPEPDDPTGQSVMQRIPEIFDVWFDSGSMSYAQVHYPFENSEWFDNHFPADFIVEYVGQTRGWFYLAACAGHAIFDRPAFTNCISHGIVLGPTDRRCRSLCATTPMSMRSSTATARTPCAGSSWPRRSCAAETSSSPNRASATVSARSCSRCGTPGSSSPPTPTRPMVRRVRSPSTRPRHGMTRLRSSTGTCLPRPMTSSPNSARRWKAWTSGRPANSSAATSICSRTGTCAARAVGSGTAAPTRTNHSTCSSPAWKHSAESQRLCCRSRSKRSTAV